LSRYAARGSVGGLARCRSPGRTCARTGRARTAAAVHHVDYLDRVGDVVAAVGSVAAATAAAGDHVSAFGAGPDGAAVDACRNYIDNDAERCDRVNRDEWRCNQITGAAIRRKLGHVAGSIERTRRGPVG
jgi:hypothetical protein